jgi:hypothetical protein
MYGAAQRADTVSGSGDHTEGDSDTEGSRSERKHDDYDTARDNVNSETNSCTGEAFADNSKTAGK